MVPALAGKVAIVTGGANGIGRATVELFVKEGACVVIADTDRELGESLAQRIGRDAIFRQTDVSRSDEVQALVDAAVSRFGGLDIMFNNAGISGTPHGRFLDDDLADFNRVMSVNLFGVMLGCRFAGKYMACHGGGSIINTASIGGSFPGFGITTYRAAKAGVLHFTKSLAIDLAEYDIRVNSVSPGHIPTEMTTFNAGAGLPPAVMARLKGAMTAAQSENQPLKRVGSPEDVAQAVVFLASDRSAYITGIDIAVDGGTAIGDPVNRQELMLAARARVLSQQDRAGGS